MAGRSRKSRMKRRLPEFLLKPGGGLAALSASEQVAGMRGSMPVLARMTWPQNSTLTDGPKPCLEAHDGVQVGPPGAEECTVSPDDLMAEVAHSILGLMRNSAVGLTRVTFNCWQGSH
jgi:hypothetical protein